MLPSQRHLKQNAPVLRSSMTDPEQKLWIRLRRKQINGWQFYRQKPIGPSIVDFSCSAAGLVVELDGSQHPDPPQHSADQRREALLEKLALRVLRFDNRQVLLETDTVVEAIAGIPPIPPLPKGGAAHSPGPLSSDKQTPPASPFPLPEGGDALIPSEPFLPEYQTTAIPPFAKGGQGGISPATQMDDAPFITPNAAAHGKS